MILCDVGVFCSSRPLLCRTAYNILVTLFLFCGELTVWCDKSAVPEGKTTVLAQWRNVPISMKIAMKMVL